ncbi:MAG: DUF559 domain-containing protein, partial [Polyangiaceae bacterium]
PATRRGLAQARTLCAAPTTGSVMAAAMDWKRGASSADHARARHRSCAVGGKAPARGRGEEVAMSRIRRSHLSAIATQLRHAPTFGEAALWEELRSAKLGVTFRRQVPLRGYIVDF